MAEKNYLVLTAVGPDRPGLVNEISSLVLAARAEPRRQPNGHPGQASSRS